MRSRRNFIYGIWVVLGVCVVASLLVSVDYKLKQYEQGAMHGMAWLRAYPTPYENAGVMWALDEINRTYCKSEQFSKELAYRFQKEQHTETERAYFSLLSFSTSSPMTGLDKRSGKYDYWLLSVLACKEQPLSQELLETLLNVEQTTGYDLSHKYLALSYLSRSSCVYNRMQVERARDTMAQKIRGEAEQGGYIFTDLLAEQAALLLWGGNGFLVTPLWVDSIALAQRASGGWTESRSAYKENTHTTALSLWTLTQVTRACPL